MKVLHIFNEIKYSGAEIMYANAATLFRESRIELYAFATGKLMGDFEPEFSKNGIPVWHMSTHELRSVHDRINYVKNVLKFIKENKIDLIHIHRADVKWLFSLIAKLAGIGCIYTVHNVFKNRKATWIYAYLIRLSSRKLFGLKYHSIGQSVYENELNYYKTPSVVINNWFDEKKFYPALSSQEVKNLRAELEIDPDSFVLISTGGCSVVKNHHAIIEAIALLPDNKNITYLHLGSGHTEHEEKLLCSQLGLKDNVRFLGNKVNVREYLIVSDAYIMPSIYEGLGNAALEAMACGVPSILYNVPGLKDLINSDNENGLLIEPKMERLVTAIEWIRRNPELVKGKAEKALYFVDRDFSMKGNVSKMINLYLSLV